VGQHLRSGHAIVLGSTDPTAARGGRPRCHHQRVSAEPATRRPPRPGARIDAAFADDERRQFQVAPPATQAVVIDDRRCRRPIALPDAIGSITSPVADGFWDTVVTLRSTRAARIYEPGNFGYPGVPDPLADGRGLRDTITSRLGRSRLVRKRGSPRSSHHRRSSLRP